MEHGLLIDDCSLKTSIYRCFFLHIKTTIYLYIFFFVHIKGTMSRWFPNGNSTILIEVAQVPGSYNHKNGAARCSLRCQGH